MRPQLLIALLAGVAFSLDMFAVYTTLGNAQSIYGGFALVLMLLYAGIPILLWTVGTGVVYTIASLINARVELNILWRMLGWGMIPLVGCGLTLSAGRYMALASRQPCQYLVCEAGTYVKITDQAEDIYAYSGTALGEPLTQAFVAVSIVLLILMAYFWVIAAYRASTLTRTGAVIAAGIPGLVFTTVFAMAVL